MLTGGGRPLGRYHGRFRHDDAFAGDLHRRRHILGEWPVAGARWAERVVFDRHSVGLAGPAIAPESAERLRGHYR